MAADSDGLSLADLVGIVERFATRLFHFEVSPDLLTALVQGLGAIALVAVAIFFLFNASRTIAALLRVFAELLDLVRVLAVIGWRRILKQRSSS